jgi:type VI protein secretion system component VasK
VEKASKEPGGDAAVRTSAEGARLNRRQLASTFPADPEGHIEQRTDDLLEQPIKNLDGVGMEGLRAGGTSFCAAFKPLTDKFPFKPEAQPEVTLAELAAILQPGSGRLWTFYNGPLKEFVKCENGQCKATNPAISATFVDFLSRMMQFSRALYGESGTEVKYNYTLQPVKSDQIDTFMINVNGEQSQLKGGVAKAFLWPGPGNTGFQLALKLQGASATLGPPRYDGLWGLFHFFANSERTNPSGAGSVFGWTLRSGGRDNRPVEVDGKAVTYDIFVDTKGEPAIFSQRFLSTLRCTGPLAR